MRSPALLIFLLWPLALSAQETLVYDSEPGNYGVPTHEIFVREQESLDASIFGIDPHLSRPEAVGWRGSDPQALATLAGRLNGPLAWPAAREAAKLALTAPVLPDGTESVPKNWLQLRIEALLRIGEYQTAWKLFQTLPKNLLTEPLARLGAESAWASGQVHPACDLVNDLIKDASTEFPNDDAKLYWLSHFTLCQKLSGETAKAELTIGLLQESAGHKLPPLLAPLIEGWDGATALPALSERDAPLYAALAGLLLDDASAPGLSGRIGENFIPAKSADAVYPPLAAALVRADRLDPATRAALAERAANYRLLDGEKLAMPYAELSGSGMSGSYPATRSRALRYSDVVRAAAPGERVAALTSAFNEMRGVIPTEAARELFALPLQSSAEDVNAGVPLPLLLQAAALFLDRHDGDRAETLGRNLQSRGGAENEAAARAILAAAALDRAPGPLVAAEPPTDQGIAAARYVQVMQALGANLPTFAPTGPLDLSYPDPDQLQAFEAAEAKSANGEALLRSAMLLGHATPERTSDGAFVPVIDFYHRVGLDTLASSAAVSALTSLPAPAVRR